MVVRKLLLYFRGDKSPGQWQKERRGGGGFEKCSNTGDCCNMEARFRGNSQG